MLLSLYEVRHEALPIKDNMKSGAFDFRGALVSNGRLMSPPEIQEVIFNRNGVPGLQAGWCLCGDTTKSMFDAVVKHGNGVDVRLSGFVGPANGAFATITQQLGGMQHRFLLPLFEPPIIAFLKALERQPIQVMLGRERQTQALMLHNAPRWRDIVPLVEMCQQNRSVGVGETLEEMTEVIHAVSRLETIPSVYAAIGLTEVSVSVIVPSMYCLSMGAREPAESGELK